jgi:outer membrane immunogenic protein
VLVCMFSGAFMKKLATCVIAVAGLIGTPVLAADLATKGAPPPPPPPPVFSWAGLYIGVNAGGAFGNKVTEEPTGLFFSEFEGAPLLPTSSNQSGFTGGGLFGYNWQFDSVVVGIEGDFNYVDFRDINFTVTGLPSTPFGSGSAPHVFNYFHSGDRFFGTFRVRLGYAADRALFYATGGLAFSGKSSNTGTATFTNAEGVQFANFHGPTDSGIGFAVGGGVEYAWTNNWIVRAEYLFVDIDHHNVTLTDPVTSGAAGFSFSSTVGEQFSVVRGAISYKF